MLETHRSCHYGGLAHHFLPSCGDILVADATGHRSQRWPESFRPFVIARGFEGEGVNIPATAQAGPSECATSSQLEQSGERWLVREEKTGSHHQTQTMVVSGRQDGRKVL